MKKILVLLPTYNEKDNVVPILSAIHEVAKQNLPHYSVEVLVIDDNSPDGTADIVREQQKALPGIHLISGEKAGLGNAYLRGFRHGLSQDKYEAFIMMDADFSHDPHAIPLLLKQIEAGADYVIGSRYVFGGSIPGSWPLIRIINSRVANNIARLLTGMDQDITDLTGGFKAIRVAAFEKLKLNDIHGAGYFFQVSLLHAFWSKGLIVKEVPITFTDRRYGVSKLRLRDIAEFLYRAYRLNPASRLRQLMRFGFVGICGTLVNLTTLQLLVHYGDLSPVIGVAIAIEVSIIFNFFMNHFYTFKFVVQHPDHTTRGPKMVFQKLVKFNGGMLSGALISFTTFTLLHKLLGLHYILADTISILVAMSWNYWVSTTYVWRAAGVRAEEEGVNGDNKTR